MPQIINTNISSLTAQRNLNTSQGANAQSLERLSSGLRINSAKDDAAGLAISTKFESQVMGLNQAIRNAGDGISLAQTAEGALGSMTENLQRIRELAVQSSNATNSDDDRVALQQEVSALMAEVSRTAEDTNFNGRTLLDGNFNATFQIGANAGNTVDVEIAELTVGRLGSSDQAGVAAVGSDNGIANGDLIINGVSIGPSQSSDDTASVDGAEASAISKVATINRSSDETGVTAYVATNELNGSAMTSTATVGGETGSILLNGVSIDITTTDNSTEAERVATRAAVVAAINSKSDLTGVTAVDSGSDGSGVVLQAADGRNITMTTEAGASAGFDSSATGLTGLSAVALSTNTYEGGYTLVARGDTKEISIQGGTGIGGGDLSNAGLVEGTYSRATAVVSTETQTAVITSTGLLGDNTTGGFGTVASGTQYTTAALLTEAFQNEVNEIGLQDGDLVLNGVTIGASSSLDDTASDTTALTSDGASSGIAIAAAINEASETTGIYAEVNATQVVGGSTTTAVASSGQVMDLWINNVDIGSVISQGDREKDVNATIDLINAKSGQTGVVAEFNGVSITMTAEDGRNISVFTVANASTGSASWGLDAAGDGIGGYADAGVLFSTGFVGASLGFVSTVSAGEAGAAIAAATLSAGVIQLTTAGAYSTGIAAAYLAETTYSTVTLSSSKEMVVDAGTNGNEGLQDSGFNKGSFGRGTDGQYLSEVDVSTFQGAQDAITAIDNALKTVASQRAELGAMQNRFESTVSNLAITSENLSAANSRIRDADFAAETAEMSRTQVLQQAGISILAQANQKPQQVLSLLG